MKLNTIVIPMSSSSQGERIRSSRPAEVTDSAFWVSGPTGREAEADAA